MPSCGRTRPTGAPGARSGSCWPVAAPGGLRLPGWVVTTGFVDAQARADLLDAAEVVALPSPHESLSLVALEAWRARTADAGERALRGARRPDRALGRRPALRRRPPPTPASSPGSRPTPSCGRCSAAAGSAFLPGRPGMRARAGGGPSSPGCGARSPDPSGRDDAGLALPGPQRRPGEHQPTEPPAGATRASTSRGVGRRPSNQARAATRTVAESTAGRSKCPISSTRNPAVAGPTPASPCSSAYVRSPSPVAEAASISARVPSIADRAAARIAPPR